VNFCDSRGGGDAPTAPSAPAAKSGDVVIQDLDSNEINLDDIPF
jgi:hypothetical protein